MSFSILSRDNHGYKEAINFPTEVKYDEFPDVISTQIMTIHHSKHHQTYFNNYNNLRKNIAAATSQDKADAEAVVNFNWGGFINHCLFWENLTSKEKEKGFKNASPELQKAITELYVSYDKFQEAFIKSLMTIQGSGWSWLVLDKNKKLKIMKTANQDIVPLGEVPLIGIDAWEHAYYLQYQNNKASYFENIWKIINWKCASDRYSAALESAKETAMVRLDNSQI